jgi:nanoRNase/pAp phosphatase (c-di-AMP/oligoRNAs hydrolase)
MGITPQSVGNGLKPYGMVYDLVKNEWWISLRGSKSKCPDLSKIAKYFGGGGHYGAAAFTISHPLTLRDVFAIN